jgi:hypothetical protein
MDIVINLNLKILCETQKQLCQPFFLLSSVQSFCFLQSKHPIFSAVQSKPGFSCLRYHPCGDLTVQRTVDSPPHTQPGTFHLLKQRKVFAASPECWCNSIMHLPILYTQHAVSFLVSLLLISVFLMVALPSMGVQGVYASASLRPHLHSFNSNNTQQASAGTLTILLAPKDCW